MIRHATIADAAAILRIRIASIKGLACTHYSAEDVDAWCGKRTPEMYHVAIEEKVVLVDE